MTNIGYEAGLPNSGCIGCLLVAPIGLFGTFMILDYPGPPGCFGFAEYFGWWAICLLIAFVVSTLLRRRQADGRRNHLMLLLAIATVIGFALLTYADVHPTTPANVKRAVEYTLQAIGALAILLALVVLSWFVWKSRNR